MRDNKCPWNECDKPWTEHEGIAKIVHAEKAEYSARPKTPGRPNGCRCPILRVGDFCPVHGG